MLTREQARNRFRGVVVPLVTIFAEDGSLDLDGTASNVQWIIDQGAGSRQHGLPGGRLRGGLHRHVPRGGGSRSSRPLQTSPQGRSL